MVHLMLLMGLVLQFAVLVDEVYPCACACQTNGVQVWDCGSLDETSSM